jgi:adenine deaminase
MDYLIIGRNYADMMEAFAYVHQRGGIAIVEEGKVAAHLDLPIGGGLSPLPMRELISECASFQEVLKKKGYPFDDPFYCLLFLTSTHLPKLRITEKGIISIKEQKIILPSEPLQK